MPSSLIDAGPLIALFDKDDSWHRQVLKRIKHFQGKLLTTWPVITEAMYMLRFSLVAQQGLLNWIDRGGLHVVELQREYVKRLIHLMNTYSNVPMDLADASLMVVSEMEEIESIFTIDSDFHIYRNIRKRPLTNILGKREDR